MKDSSEIEPCGTPAPEQNADPAVFTNCDYRNVLNVCRSDLHTYWYPAVVIAWHTGLKLREIALLRWDAINWEEETLTVALDTRLGTIRSLHLPLHPEAIDLLSARKDHLKYPGNPYVQPDMAGHYLIDRHKTLSCQFVRLCRKAGIEGKSFSAFRRTFIRDSVLAGLNNQVIADVTGICDLRRFERLASLPQDLKRKQLHRLSLYRGGFLRPS